METVPMCFDPNLISDLTQSGLMLVGSVCLTIIVLTLIKERR